MLVWMNDNRLGGKIGTHRTGPRADRDKRVQPEGPQLRFFACSAPSKGWIGRASPKSAGAPRSASQASKPARHKSLKLPVALRPKAPSPIANSSVEGAGFALAQLSIKYPPDVKRGVRKFKERSQLRRAFLVKTKAVLRRAKEYRL